MVSWQFVYTFFGWGVYSTNTNPKTVTGDTFRSKWTPFKYFISSLEYDERERENELRLSHFVLGTIRGWFPHILFYT